MHRRAMFRVRMVCCITSAVPLQHLLRSQSQILAFSTSTPVLAGLSMGLSLHSSDMSYGQNFIHAPPKATRQNFPDFAVRNVEAGSRYGFKCRKGRALRTMTTRYLRRTRIAPEARKDSLTSHDGQIDHRPSLCHLVPTWMLQT